MGLVNSKPNKRKIIPVIYDVENLPITPDGYMNKEAKPSVTKYRIANKKIYSSVKIENYGD